jgi:hypothetical protein
MSVASSLMDDWKKGEVDTSIYNCELRKRKQKKHWW